MVSAVKPPAPKVPRSDQKLPPVFALYSSVICCNSQMLWPPHHGKGEAEEYRYGCLEEQRVQMKGRYRNNGWDEPFSMAVAFLESFVGCVMITGLF